MVLSGLGALMARVSMPSGRKVQHALLEYPHPYSIMIKMKNGSGGYAAMESIRDMAKTIANGVSGMVQDRYRRTAIVIQPDTIPGTDMTVPADYNYMGIKLTAKEMAVFRCLGANGDCTLEDLWNSTGLSPKEAFGAARTLWNRGFVERDQNFEYYRITEQGTRALSYHASLDSRIKSTPIIPEATKTREEATTSSRTTSTVGRASRGTGTILRRESRGRIASMSEDSPL